MNYKPMTKEEFASYVEKLEKTHGRAARAVAAQMEWQRMVVALFDEARPKGRRFQVTTEYAEKVWVPDESAEPKHTRDDKDGNPVFEQPFKRIATESASFQIWEDVNYGTPQRKAPNELWRGIKVSCPRDSEPEEVEEMMADAFKLKDWPLKDE